MSPDIDWTEVARVTQELEHNELLLETAIAALDQHRDDAEKIKPPKSELPFQLYIEAALNYQRRVDRWAANERRMSAEVQLRRYFLHSIERIQQTLPVRGGESEPGSGDGMEETPESSTPSAPGPSAS